MWRIFGSWGVWRGRNWLKRLFEILLWKWLGYYIMKNIFEVEGLLNFYVVRKEGDTLNNKHKIKYDSEYISYVENGDSVAVFIVRDIVRSIDTSGMWIDVISTSGYKNEYGR